MEVTKTNFLFRVVISLKKEKSFARIKISIKREKKKRKEKQKTDTDYDRMDTPYLELLIGIAYKYAQLMINFFLSFRSVKRWRVEKFSDRMVKIDQWKISLSRSISPTTLWIRNVKSYFAARSRFHTTGIIPLIYSLSFESVHNRSISSPDFPRQNRCATNSK